MANNKNAQTEQKKNGGASKQTSAVKENGKGDGKGDGKDLAPAQTAAAGTPAAEEKPKRPATTVNSLGDLVKLPEAERKKLIEMSQTRAHVTAGTTGMYVRADGKGFTDKKEEAKRAQDGRGRLIGQYTPPRPGDVVAVEELTRMMRLAWSLEARAKAVEAAGKRKTPLTDDDLLKILKECNAPESYLRPKASKKLYGRVLSFLREGEDALNAIVGKK